MNDYVHYAIFDQTSGKILRVITSTPDMVDLQKGPGEEALIVSEDVDDSTHYVDVENALLLLYPEKPSQFHTFNYSTHAWEDPRSFLQKQDLKWEELKQAREDFIDSPLSALGFTFDANRAKGDQDNIKGAAQLAQFALFSQVPFSTTFTLFDNSRHTFSAEEIIQVGLALGARTEYAHAHSSSLREAVYSASSEAELDAIQW